VSVHHNIVPHADRLEEKCIELSELNEQLVDKNDDLVKELETWRLKFTDVDHDFQIKAQEVVNVTSRLKESEEELKKITDLHSESHNSLGEQVTQNGKQKQKLFEQECLIKKLTGEIRTLN